MHKKMLNKRDQKIQKALNVLPPCERIFDLVHMFPNILELSIVYENKRWIACCEIDTYYHAHHEGLQIDGVCGQVLKQLKEITANAEKFFIFIEIEHEINKKIIQQYKKFQKTMETVNIK